MNAIERLQRFLAREVTRAERELELALDALAAVTLTNASGRYAPLEPAQLAVARLVSRVKALGDLSGRISVRWPRAKAAEPDMFALAGSWDDVLRIGEEAGPQGPQFLDSVPSVVFDAAVRDLESRDTYGARFLRDMGLSVAQLYGPVTMGPTQTPQQRARAEFERQAAGLPREAAWGSPAVVFPHGFAAARAATADVAGRVQAALITGLRDGRPTEEVAQEIAADQGWSAPYARNVTRTTYNTSSTAGRFTEAASVHAAGIPVGFEIQCVEDSNLRDGRDGGENHAAMNGFRARVDDPVWLTHTPPYGYQCRCLASPIMGDEVPAKFQQAPREARFAPGFGTRGDLRTYG